MQDYTVQDLANKLKEAIAASQPQISLSADGQSLQIGADSVTKGVASRKGGSLRSR